MNYEDLNPNDFANDEAYHNAIMKTAGIKEITPEGGNDKYEVYSSSGNTYIIEYTGSYGADDEFVATWECNCRAGQSGKLCKHIKLVINVMDYLDGYG